MSRWYRLRILYFCLPFFVCDLIHLWPLRFFKTPWDNRNGWLGVKHQITYLLTFFQIHQLLSFYPYVYVMYYDSFVINHMLERTLDPVHSACINQTLELIPVQLKHAQRLCSHTRRLHLYARDRIGFNAQKHSLHAQRPGLHARTKAWFTRSTAWSVGTCSFYNPGDEAMKPMTVPSVRWCTLDCEDLADLDGKCLRRHPIRVDNKMDLVTSP